MIEFISENLGSVFVGILVLSIISAIILRLIHNKRKGRNPTCGCGCSGCPKSSSCESE